MPDRIAFVLSTGRTGTKSLAEGLAGDDVSSPHQPPFSRILTVASNYHLHGWLPRSTLEWLVKKTRLHQIESSGARCYVQVFSLDYLPAKIVTEWRPDTRIVHIVRDPRTFVPSYLNWKRTRRRSYIANKFVLGWHPAGYLVGEMSFRDWHQMDEFQRVCWQWSFKNRLIEELFGDYEHYMCVRFEDLFTGYDNQGVLESVLSFIGIHYLDRYAVIYEKTRNRSKKRFTASSGQWSSEKHKHLYRLCGEQMAKYGYDTVQSATTLDWDQAECES